MGDWESRRRGGRPLKEGGTTIDLPLVFRKGWMREGRCGGGTDLKRQRRLLQAASATATI